jgi:hypothetical protein
MEVGEMTQAETIAEKKRLLDAVRQLVAEKVFLEKRLRAMRAAHRAGNSAPIREVRDTEDRIAEIKFCLHQIQAVRIPALNERLGAIADQGNWDKEQRRDFFEHFYRVATRMLPKETWVTISGAAKIAMGNQEHGTAQRLTGQVLPALSNGGGFKLRGDEQISRAARSTAPRGATEGET